MDLTNKYIILYPDQLNMHSFISAHRIFSRIEHILGNKINLSKFKKIEIISNIFSTFYKIRNQQQQQQKKNHTCTQEKNKRVAKQFTTTITSESLNKSDEKKNTWR